MSFSGKTSDCYQLHRLALAPLIADTPERTLATFQDALSAAQEEPLLTFILQQGLGPLWYETIRHFPSCTLSAFFTDSLRKSMLFGAETYVRQQRTLQKIDTLFTTHALDHAIFKGAHIRELVYPDPALRTACDIDILVAAEDKVRAISVLVAAGFSLHPVSKSISHEVMLRNEDIIIDLHWDIMRPGRTRVALTNELLAARKRYTNHWGLCHEATLFIMLVHSVFTKYTTTSYATLNRLIDLTRWVQTVHVDWPRIHDWLKRAGLQTAAWITAQWLEQLTGISLPENFSRRIKPGAARSTYLRTWLKYNLSSRLLFCPLFIHGGFTLPAHDTIGDTLHAIKSLTREKRHTGKNMKELTVITTESVPHNRS